MLLNAARKPYRQATKAIALFNNHFLSNILSICSAVPFADFQNGKHSPRLRARFLNLRASENPCRSLVDGDRYKSFIVHLIYLPLTALTTNLPRPWPPSLPAAQKEVWVRAKRSKGLSEALPAELVAPLLDCILKEVSKVS